MKLYFLNVGYGEAIVVQAGGRTVVVDGGPGRDSVYADRGTIRLSRFLAEKGVRRVDLMCVTHIHEDHISGLPEVAEQCEIGEIWCNIRPEGDVPALLRRLGERARADRSGDLFYRAIESYGRLREIAARRGIPFYAVAGDGAARQLGPLTIRPLGMTQAQQAQAQRQFEELFTASDERLLFDRFHESDFICNATSLALHVREGGGAALLTGDKVGGWQALRAAHDLRAQVLKITHHGQKDGMPQDMLEAADPEAIVVCADRARTFHSADPAVLRRAERYLLENDRPPRIFVTGSLEEAGREGSVLALEIDPQKSCTNASVESYETSCPNDS